MELIWRTVLLGAWIVAGAITFYSGEAVLEGVLAIILVGAVLLGFLLHPRKEVFYVRTAVQL